MEAFELKSQPVSENEIRKNTLMPASVKFSDVSRINSEQLLIDDWLNIQINGEYQHTQVLSGWGNIRKPFWSIFGWWRTTFIVFHNFKFKYYKDINSEEPIEILDLRKTEIEVESVVTNRFRLIINSERILDFKVESEDDRDMYVNGIAQGILDVKQRHMSIRKPGYKPYKNLITAKNFVKTCDTGDLLLFKKKDIWLQLQSSIALEDYDHVSMIYKDNNKIYILEHPANMKKAKLTELYSSESGIGTLFTPFNLF